MARKLRFFTDQVNTHASSFYYQASYRPTPVDSKIQKVLHSKQQAIHCPLLAMRMGAHISVILARSPGGVGGDA
jgi:hypothetical protein